jgi:DNA transformation protein
MAKENEFVAHLVELLECLGPVRAKAMFGGFGIYLKGLMFGLVSDDTLYFKVDEKNRPDYEERDLGPFTYRRGDKEFAMSYHRAPGEAIDDAQELCAWAKNAYGAAVRVAGNKQRKKLGKKGSK